MPAVEAMSIWLRRSLKIVVPSFFNYCSPLVIVAVRIINIIIIIIMMMIIIIVIIIISNIITRWRKPCCCRNELELIIME